jgi:glycine cleavage system T protein
VKEIDVSEGETGKRELPREVQVAIIGGGVVGCSVAYHLAKRSFSDVHLFERRELTCGTTWHAAGLVGQLRATANLTRLAVYTAQLFKGLEAESGQPTGLKQNGSISIATSEARWTELRRSAAMAQNFGLVCEVLTPKELARRWPQFETADVVGALFMPSDGQTNPIDTTRALAAAARQNGAAIHQNVAVNRILQADGRVIGIETPDGPIRARHVVLAAGMWSRDLAAAAGVSVPLHAAEHFYAVTEAVPGLPANFPVLRDPDHCLYMKEDAGKILVGCFEPIAKPWGMNGIPENFCFDELPPDLEHFMPFLEHGMKRLPLIADVGIRTWFNGPESFTPDDRYLLGEAPELRNLWMATGFNSIGIQSSGGAGKVLADWIADGHPPMDLWDVDIRRMQPFQSNRRYLHDRTVEGLGLLYAMHWPFRQVETARGARKSVLHDRLAAAGACFGEAAGWERANWYAPPGTAPQYEYRWGRQNWFAQQAAEHKAVREAVGLFDQSSFAKFLLQGRDAQRVLNRISTADMAVPVGKVVYTQWLNPRGGIEADLTVTRTGEEQFLIVTSGTSQVRDMDWLRRSIGADEHAIATDVGSGHAVVSLMGPNARALLGELTNADLSNAAFPFGTSQVIDLAYAKVRATRITYVGELGWELYIPTEFAQGVYDAILAAGTRHGLRHAGYHAMNSLRLEKAYRHWGHDIGDEDTPLQSGLGFTVAWDKPGGFTGREALLVQRQQGVRRRLAVFRLEDPDAFLFHDEPIWRDGARVGHLTSGDFGHTIGAPLGMGYVAADGVVTPDWVREGRYEIEIAGTRVPASVSLQPPYDPRNQRVRI